MRPLLGSILSLAALGVALVGVVMAVMAARSGNSRAWKAARWTAYTNLWILLVANLLMVQALVVRDFSVSYVAQVGSHATPLLFTIISLWAALEGSILFWGLILAGYTALAVYIHRRAEGPMIPYATAVMLGVGAFFYLLLVGPANPFVTVSPVPLDGPGPNPLLQNHPLMALHPPLLYLGYVGMTVPFAFAMGALLAGRVDDSWLRLTRRWMLVAWTALSLAVVAGMWWSYEVLGWGGYWAWDPVENASFLPWLTATALLHSAMVQERRDMLRIWNMTLVISTFLLTILGTFLTRSGVLSSVHAFADGAVGSYFLGFMAVSLIFSVVLLLGRSKAMSTPGTLDSALSRETVFLLNNLFLVAFTFTVLLGTLFPLLAEAVRGVTVSVGAPFFNRMTLPFVVALLFLMGVGPALPWGRAKREGLGRRFVFPLAAMVAVGILVPVIWGLRDPYATMAFAFAAFALVTNVGEYLMPVRNRMRVHGEGVGRAMKRVAFSNPRRYGGYFAHLGVVVMAVGIAASSALQTSHEATLRPGETMTVEDYTLRYEGMWAEDQPQRFSVGATLVAERNGRSLGTMEPRLNYYPTQVEPVPTPAVRSRMTDLYVVLMAFQQDGSSATISAIVEPLVMWIWIGGGMVGAGALFGLFMGPRVAVRRGGADDSNDAARDESLVLTGVET
ncbi:MAG: heme lyase CcmF/NrfE family subunit [Gemmatimonadota bacterium]